MDKDLILDKDERLDDLGLKGLNIIQNKNFFCFGVDSVMLCDFAKINKNDTVLDLGTGNGIIPLLLYGKNNPEHITGLEIQEENVKLANKSVVYNNLSEKIRIVQGDIKEADKIFKDKIFDAVITNPPYINGGIKNKISNKTVSRHEVLCSIEDIIRVSNKLLKFKGRLYIIHKPHRLTDIFYFMRKYKIEPKKLTFVQPYIDKEPKMVLIEGVNYGSSWLKVTEPIIMYEK